MPREDTLRFRRSLYEEAVAILERECHTELELGDVARRIFTSDRQLQRAFGEAGTSFRERLWAARMERAAELIRADPTLRIADVARSVGHSQQAQFAKAFRRHWGVAPTEFRSACGAERVGEPAAA